MEERERPQIKYIGGSKMIKEINNNLLNNEEEEMVYRDWETVS